jgi:ClpX C4-type zinc finger
MLLLGGSATGVWLASTGLVRLERRFVLAIGGRCSFCDKDRSEVQTLLGQRGMPATICNECLGLCFDIMREELFQAPPPAPSPVFLEPDVDAVVVTLRELAAAQNSRHVEELVDRVRRSLFPKGPRLAEFQCSFCARRRSDVAQLISGPKVFICDGCVFDAAATSGIARASTSTVPGATPFGTG